MVVNTVIVVTAGKGDKDTAEWTRDHIKKAQSVIFIRQSL